MNAKYLRNLTLLAFTLATSCLSGCGDDKAAITAASTPTDNPTLALPKLSLYPKTATIFPAATQNLQIYESKKGIFENQCKWMADLKSFQWSVREGLGALQISEDGSKVQFAAPAGEGVYHIDATSADGRTALASTIYVSAMPGFPNMQFPCK